MTEEIEFLLRVIAFASMAITAILAAAFFLGAYVVKVSGVLP